jgi:hypothetical protein
MYRIVRIDFTASDLLIDALDKLKSNLGNSIDPGITFRVSFTFSGARQERRDLFRLPSMQA